MNIFKKIKETYSTIESKIKSEINNFKNDLNNLNSEEEADKKLIETPFPWENLIPSNENTIDNYNELIKNEILFLAKKEDNLLIKDEEYIYDFPFNLNNYIFLATKMIEYDENLGILRNKIVPKRISENHFWKNYFYNIEIIKYKYNVNNLINKNVESIENKEHSIKININEEKKELGTEKNNNENKSGIEIKEKIEKNDYIINFDSHNLIDYENICNILEKVQNNIDEKEKIKEIIKEYRIERRKKLHNPNEYICTIEFYETEIRTLQLKGILDLMKIDQNLFWHSFFYEKESHPQIIEKLMEIRFFLCLDFSNKKIEKNELDKILDQMNNKKSDIINEFIDSIQTHKSTNELNKKLHKSIFLYILISDVIYELFNVEEEDIKFSIKELIDFNQNEGEDLSENFHNLYCNEINLLTNVDFIN